MANSVILRKSLYGVLGTTIALYLALLILFAIDKAYAAIAISTVGLITGIIGIVGVKRQSFPMLMTYSAMSFAWILLAIIHVAMIANLFRANDQNTDELFVGKTLLSRDTNNPQVRVFHILYLTFYSLAITITAVGMMLACLLPTPDGTGWRYPWMKSKASVGDPYYDEWNDEFNPPYPYPFMGAPMLLGIPTTPIMPVPPPRGMTRGGRSRSMPQFYDPRMLYGGRRYSGEREYEEEEEPPYRGPRRRSSSNLGYQDRPNNNDRSPSPPPARRDSVPERRASFDFNATRRRSSAADNYGFL